MTAPTCEALAEMFDIRCGDNATVVGSLGERWAYLCSDCANRAIRHGWVIGPTVQDVEDCLNAISRPESDLSGR